MSDAALAQSCQFSTARLTVTSWRELLADAASRDALANRVMEILTPTVTKTLPSGWQGIETQDHAHAWIVGMSEAAEIFNVRLTATKEIIGFLTVYVASDTGSTGLCLHIGYVLAEATWGQGLGGELIDGFVGWCRQAGNVREILGFVEPDNVASAKVLTRNGFAASGENDSDDMIAFKLVLAAPT